LSALRNSGAYRPYTIERLIVTGTPSRIRLSIHLESGGYVEADYELSRATHVKR